MNNRWDIAENELGVAISMGRTSEKRVLVNSIGQWSETLPTTLGTAKVVVDIDEIDGKKALVFRPSFSAEGHVLNLVKTTKQWVYCSTKATQEELEKHIDKAYKLTFAYVQEGHLPVKEAIVFFTPDNEIKKVNNTEAKAQTVASPTLQVAKAVADLQKAFDTKCRADANFKKTVLDILGRIETNQKHTQQAICALKEEWQ